MDNIIFSTKKERYRMQMDKSIEQHKARMVIHLNKQVEGIRYNETFASTTKMVTIHSFLAIEATKNFKLHQMDVYNAFLHKDSE